LDTVSTVPR